MTMQENKLALSGRQTEDAAGRLVHWVRANRERVGFADVSLVRDLQRYRATAKLLARSASRPPAVAVVGPSALGRTLVVGGLTRSDAGRATIQFAGLPYGVDYLAYVAPGEESSSLGIAARLSPRPKSSPPGFPVPVRLLSVADIARILATIYFTEPGLSVAGVPDRGAIDELCRMARQDTAPYPIPGLTTRDVIEIREYVETQFGDDPIVRGLAATDYWQVLARSAPRLSDAMRADLLEQLWPGQALLTGLFVELVDALGRLGHSSEAYVPLEAIVEVEPSSAAVSRARSSLLDASCQLVADGGSADLVVVQGQKGHKPAIPRAALAGIIAEVRLTLATVPGAGLGEAEIVEFPAFTSAGGEVASPAGTPHGRRAIREVFLASKSLYHLQRCALEREITSMVVCADDRPCNLGRFPSVLAEWVELLHGTTPGEREAVDVGLFLALVEPAGTHGERAVAELKPGQGWSARLSAALFESFTAVGDWPQEWSPGRPFDNVFLIREPRTRAAVQRLLTAATAPAPLAAASAVEQGQMSEARQTFLADETVGRHIVDPRTAWDEALQPDDGGISYLCHSVAGVTDSFTKYRQISHALAQLRGASAARLRRYNAAEDIFSHREARHRSALIAVARLRRAAEKGRFGHILQALQVSPSELATVFVALTRADPPAGGEARAGALPAIPLDAPRENAQAGAASGDLVASRSKAERYAHAALQYWLGSMRAVANNPRRCWEIGISGPVLAIIVDEITEAADRLAVADTVGRAMGRCFIRNLDPQAEARAAAVPAADAVAGFVKWLGYHGVAGERRPRRRNKARTPIFPPRQMTASAAMADLRMTADERYHLDWCQAYIAIVEDNVATLFERRARGDAERKLGEVLRNLETNPAEAHA